MAKRDTERFLRLVREANERIAADKVAKEKKPDLDPIRVQREKERRAEQGQLRARPYFRKNNRNLGSIGTGTDSTD